MTTDTKEIVEIANELMNNKPLRELAEEAIKAKPEHVKLAIEYLLSKQNKEA